MSKTSQRVQSHYHQGRKDAFHGRPFRWAKHPMLGIYRKGFHDGEQALDNVKEIRVRRKE